MGRMFISVSPTVNYGSEYYKYSLLPVDIAFRISDLFSDLKVARHCSCHHWGPQPPTSSGDDQSGHGYHVWSKLYPVVHSGWHFILALVQSWYAPSSCSELASWKPQQPWRLGGTPPWRLPRFVEGRGRKHRAPRSWTCCESWGCAWWSSQLVHVGIDG